MTNKDLSKLAVGDTCLFRSAKAVVKWFQKVEFLLHKGDPKAKEPTPDVYWRAHTVFFEVEGLKEGASITTGIPHLDIDIPELK